MMTRWLLQIVFAIIISSAAFAAIPPAPLPQTGQSTCYDTSGNVIACADAGQDGDIRAGAPWPNPRFTDNSDQTINDNMTGLIWTKDASAPGPAVCGPGITKNWLGALGYVKCLNSSNYLGRNDWRLPNSNELASLAIKEQSNIATWLTASGFSNVKNTYWSSSTFVTFYGSAWIMEQWGNFDSSGKGNSHYVWPVRGGQWSFGPSTIPIARTGQTNCYDDGDTVVPCAGTGQDGELQKGVVWPTPRFSDNGDQTMTDNLTGIIWTKDTNAPGPSACVPSITKNWLGALDYVKCLNSNNYLGLNDWRLPNANELVSLVNKQPSNIDTWLTSSGFYNANHGNYWSSTNRGESAAFLSMSDPLESYDMKYFFKKVWPIRGGQFALVITKTGSGIGSVTADSGTIRWSGTTGKESYVNGTTLALTATAGSGSVFVDWIGCEYSSGGTCSVTMSKSKDVLAKFRNPTAPTVTGFSVPTTSNLLIVPITNFTATGNVAVASFCVTDVNSMSGCSWSGTAPTTYAFRGLTQGVAITKTLYAFVRDLEGTISEPASADVTITFIDITSPNGTITVNSGAIYTTSINVNLTLSATDTNNIFQMQFSNDNSTWSPPEPYITTKTWILSTGTGTKTVYVKFQDGAGNWSGAYSDTIIFDITPPTGSATINSRAAATNSMNVNLTLSATDANGVSQMQFSNDNATWSTPETYVTGKAWTLTTGAGSKTVYVKFKDGADNWSAPLSTTILLDTTPPTPSTMSINGGAAYTKTMDVTVMLSASDNHNVAQMCLSNTASSCSSWEPYVTARPSWQLAPGDGSKTIYVWYKDVAGNTSATSSSASILLDTSIPAGGVLAATGGVGQNTLSWGSFSDAASGVGGYNLVYGINGIPASCSVGPQIYSGTGTSFTHTGLSNGTVYYYRVCAIDNAGNISTGVTAQATPNETTSPTGTITINAGAPFTNTQNVTLTLPAIDNSGVVSQMCISNTPTCNSWQPYAASKFWTVTTGDGLKTVYVWFKDGAGNATAIASSSSIRLDATAPADGQLNTYSGDTLATLAWSPASDMGSGSGLYTLVYDTNLPSAYCTNGQTLYSGTGTAFYHPDLTNGMTYYYRVCAIDNAGNTSAGTTASAKPFDSPPTGSILINSWATYTNSVNVTLTLAASDASGVQQMCLSNTTTCTTWESYAIMKPWTLVPGDGTKKVYVWFKDGLGNADLSPYSNSIILTQQGIMTATGEDNQTTLIWGGFSANTASYKLVYGTGGLPASCASGTSIYTGTANSYVHAGLTNGTMYYYRVCALDNTLNTLAGATALAKPADTAPPVGTITIKSGASETNIPNVTLTLSATDNDVVSQMCISNSSTCASWEPYATSRPWTLPTGDGTKIVYAWFMDASGNTNATPYADSISLDTTFTQDGSVSATAGDRQVMLNWSGFADELSGISNYKLVYGTGAAPSSCSAGSSVYSGAGTSFTHPRLVNGTVYYYRVCGVDNLGNASPGATTQATPSDTVPPDGNMRINVGAAYTNSPNVILTISAADSSNVAQMCLTNTATCQNWEPYTSSKPWTLSTDNGQKTVYAWLKDGVGNVNTAPCTATIILGENLSATGGDSQVALSWGGFTNATSYKLVYSPSGKLAACTAGTGIYEGTSATFSHTGLTNGITYYYRVCALDSSGNTLSGTTALAAPANNSITINNGASYTNSSIVNLSISETDMPGVTKMCLSNTSTSPCTIWESYATSRTWGLSSLNRLESVYVWFQDGAGNVSVMPFSDSITRDYLPPTSGSMTATGGEEQVTLNWNGFTDTDSGIASYTAVYSKTGIPSSCTTGTTIYTGPASSVTHANLGQGTYYYRICATDKAGNSSIGITTQAVTTDATSPTTTATPAGGTYTILQTVSLTANEPATIYYTTDGSAPTTLSTVYGSSIIIAANSTLIFFGVDLAGNTETIRQADYVFQPSNGTCGSSNGGTFSIAPSTNLCSAGLASTLTGIGSWNWSCSGTNGGSMANCSAAIPLDTIAPALALSTLANNATTTGSTLNVAGTVSDSDSGVKSVTVNGQEATIINDTFTIAVTLVDGPNTITTIVTDKANNPIADIRTITLDRTAPALTISTPADNSTTGKNFMEITGSVDDANSAVNAKVNNGTATSATMSGTNFTATLNLASGLNTIDITATDQAGNSSSAKRTMTSDTSAPTLTITTPAEDITSTQSSITISGNVTDTVTNATIGITADGQNYTPNVAANGSFSQVIILPTDKTYAVVVTASDQGNNIATVQRNIIKTPALTQPTITDALKVLQAVVGIAPLTATEQIRYDVAPLSTNGTPVGNGVIDAADVILILRRSIGIGSW